MREDEIPWAIHSWYHGWKDSPAHRNRTWSDYKAMHVQTVRDALTRPDTQRLSVDGPIPGRAVGWMAWCRGRSIDAIHWVYTSKQFRRARENGIAPAGVMTLLFDAAGLRRSVVYTFHAAVSPSLPRVGQPGRQERGRNDHWISDLLRERGHTVSHEPFAEWAK